MIMKARVKATGEIVEVKYSRQIGPDAMYKDLKTGRFYADFELSILPEDGTPDYWTRLKHQYAGMAMQAYINNNVYMREIRTECKTPKEMRELIADLSILLATALVEKLKSESNGK